MSHNNSFHARFCLLAEVSWVLEWTKPRYTRDIYYAMFGARHEESLSRKACNMHASVKGADAEGLQESKG